MPSRVLILDFGSQYTQLIARRIREALVYCEILPCFASIQTIREWAPQGLILSGGPASVMEPGAPEADPEIFSLGVPVLGICYGLQWMGKVMKGQVRATGKREYGRARIHVSGESPFFAGLNTKDFQVWMSHGDQLAVLPPQFQSLARTDTCPYAAVAATDRPWYGVQFHPEVKHTEHGQQILENFLFSICRLKPDCAVSGGVDSTVAATLVHRAVGGQLHAVFVDNGLLRLNEADRVQKLMAQHEHLRVQCVPAQARFLKRLSGVIDPEQKRKLIGHEFIEVFYEEARQHKNVTYLVQGTLYPDVIESVSFVGGPSATIKSHHNVGGLPEKLQLKLIEPLRELFKDEVRVLGRALGLPEDMIQRQPFPGPGLAVRILGEVTEERLALLREADAIVVGEIKKAGWYHKVWQSFGVLLPVKTVGVMGDARTYENVLALRVVDSQDGMTADWVPLPYELLGRIANRVINEVKGINRVVYDISSKPPATIEWE